MRQHYLLGSDRESRAVRSAIDLEESEQIKYVPQAPSNNRYPVLIAS